jgi:hypothetical protein
VSTVGLHSEDILYLTRPTTTKQHPTATRASETSIILTGKYVLPPVKHRTNVPAALPSETLYHLHCFVHVHVVIIIIIIFIIRIITIIITGWVMEISTTEGVLSIVLTVPDEAEGNTLGLLGVQNGDTSDDLTRPDGTILPSNASLKEIHEGFGMLCTFLGI